MSVKLQFKTAFALAVDDPHAPAELAGQGFFTLSHIVNRKGKLLLGCGGPGEILTQQLGLPNGKTQGGDFLRRFPLQVLGFLSLSLGHRLCIADG